MIERHDDKEYTGIVSVKPAFLSGYLILLTTWMPLAILEYIGILKFTISGAFPLVSFHAVLLPNLKARFRSFCQQLGTIKRFIAYPQEKI